jgi:hypothetical protein
MLPTITTEQKKLKDTKEAKCSELKKALKIKHTLSLRRIMKALKLE